MSKEVAEGAEVLDVWMLARNDEWMG